MAIPIEKTPFFDIVIKTKKKNSNEIIESTLMENIQGEGLAMHTFDKLTMQVGNMLAINDVQTMQSSIRQEGKAIRVLHVYTAIDELTAFTLELKETHTADMTINSIIRRVRNILKESTDLEIENSDDNLLIKVDSNGDSINEDFKEPEPKFSLPEYIGKTISSNKLSTRNNKAKYDL